MNPIISVIIPIYNVELYLGRCIESIIAQSYAYWEIILANDGSTDRSQLISEKYASTNRNITVWNLPHKGVSAARNLALSKAQGSYVCFVDADDELHPDFFKLAIEVFEQQASIDIVHVDHYRVSKQSRSIVHSKWSGLYDSQQIRADIIPDIVGPSDKDLGQRYVFTSVWGLIVRKELAAKCSFDETLFMMEDKLYLAEILQKSRHIYFSNEALYLYHMNQGSAMSTYHSNLNDNMKMLLRQLQLFAKRNFEDTTIIDGRIANLSLIAWWSICYNELYSKSTIRESADNIRDFAVYLNKRVDLSCSKRIKLLRSNITWLLLYARQYVLFIKIWRRHLGI